MVGNRCTSVSSLFFVTRTGRQGLKSLRAESVDLYRSAEFDDEIFCYQYVAQKLSTCIVTGRALTLGISIQKYSVEPCCLYNLSIGRSLGKGTVWVFVS